MAKQEERFKIIISLSVVPDSDGDFYINPSPENIERLIRKRLLSYIQTGDIKINKIDVIPSQPL